MGLDTEDKVFLGILGTIYAGLTFFGFCVFGGFGPRGFKSDDNKYIRWDSKGYSLRDSEKR